MNNEKKKIHNNENYKKIHDKQERLCLILDTARKVKEKKLGKKKKLSEIHISFYLIMISIIIITFLILSINNVNSFVLTFIIVISIIYIYLEEVNFVEES